MSLPESFTKLPGAMVTGPPPPPPLDPDLVRLRHALDGILDIAGEEHHTQRKTDNRIFIFRGNLIRDAQNGALYDTVAARFKAVGYTALLQRQRGEVTVIALEGTLSERQIRTRAWLHALLLVITLFTTSVAGAALAGLPPSATVDAALALDVPVLWPALRDGLPFSLTLLAILGTHEMGHYIAARLHGVKVTLPFFIPLPLSGSLGTLGAVILIRSPLMNRRALFDVGIAGPLAGLALAIPLFLVGLEVPKAVGNPQMWIDAGINRVSNPLLLDWVARLVTDTGNLDRYVFYGRPMALAAWFGVLLTSLNLLPLGQFDGGHVAYTLFGRRAWWLAWATFAGLVMLGYGSGWFAWLIWALMGLITGLRHPPPHDDLTPLGRTRTIIGWATVLLFPLIFVTVPFYGS